jgi:hypothetical protein
MAAEGARASVIGQLPGYLSAPEVRIPVLPTGADQQRKISASNGASATPCTQWPRWWPLQVQSFPCQGADVRYGLAVQAHEVQTEVCPGIVSDSPLPSA